MNFHRWIDFRIQEFTQNQLSSKKENNDGKKTIMVSVVLCCLFTVYFIEQHGISWSVQQEIRIVIMTESTETNVVIDGKIKI